MKKLTLIAAALLALGTTAFAATTTDTFNVSVSFTASCSVTTAAADLSFTYVGMQAGAETANTTTVFSCSRGLAAPTFAFDNPGGAQTGSAAATAGTGITAEGVIKGLRYTLSATAPSATAGSAASAGANGTGGSNGTADTYSVAISANMPGGQAGDASGAASQTRTLTISY